jgi:hypothetical protein
MPNSPLVFELFRIFVGDNPMVIVGPESDPPTVLPNRTLCAVKDISHFVETVRSYVATAVDDMELFRLCERTFKSLGMSSIVTPLDMQIEQHFRSDVEQLVLSILVLSLRHTQLCAESELDVRILTILMYLCICCMDAVKSRENIIGITVIPVSIEDIDNFTSIARYFPKSSLTCKILKRVFPRLSPTIKPCGLYIDRNGCILIRNNRQDKVVRDLTKGEETGRAVKVALDEITGHVILLRESGEVLSDIDTLIANRSKEFQIGVKNLIQDLNDILPPPQDIDGGTSTEEERLEMLPSENIRKMLHNGRVLKKRRSRNPN